MVQGSIAYFGTYSVNEAEKVISVQIEGSTFANITGARPEANCHLPHDGRIEVHQSCTDVWWDTSIGLEASQVGTALASACAIALLGHGGKHRVSRAP